MQRKHVSTVQLKAEDEGRVTAVVATTGVVDKDGDIIEPGAFGRQDVKVSAFGHASWTGALPIGRGSVREDGNRAVADLEFFMDTTPGRDTFLTLKGLGELGQWSFGYEVKRGREPTKEERRKGARRVFQELVVHEVSPVLQGAGVDTGTLALKCDGCGVEVGPKLAREAKATARSVGRYLARPPRGPRPGGSGCFTEKLARFAARVGHKLAGYPGGVLPPPDVKWFPFCETEGAEAFIRRGRKTINLALDLVGTPLVKAVLHECAHLAQDDPATDAKVADPRHPDAEPDADSFADRWTRAVEAAWRWTKGDASLVTVRHRPPPWYDTPPGAVVLHGGHAWVYNHRNVSSPWSTV